MTNAEQFFKRYETDRTLQEKVAQALAVYPGSLEVRESVAEYVLLPIAREEGLPFTVQELRAYETRKKLQNRKEDVPIEEDEPEEDPPSYWLLDRGWEWDDSQVRKREALIRDIEGRENEEAGGWRHGFAAEESAVTGCGTSFPRFRASAFLPRRSTMPSGICRKPETILPIPFSAPG